MKTIAKHIISTFCLALILFAGSPNEAKAQYTEYEIKAGLILNFARHCVWPERMFDRKQNKIILTILGSDPFGEVIENVLRGRSVQGKYYFEVRRASDIRNLRGSHIIFISKSERNNIQKIVEYINSFNFKKSAVLTMGDGIDSFCKKGGIINILEDYTFNVNWDAASDQGVILDNRLLNIANEIVPTENP
ncbi:MAG: YfiR family protein [Flammeovirgaceae bacterium]